MTYYNALRDHFQKYKETVLGIPESGAWHGTTYSHILPETREKENIVPSIRADFWRYAEREQLTRKLHRDFHHLNSSQALAFNLFFPVFENQDATNTVLAIAGMPEGPVKWQFEAVPDSSEGTNFDVLGQTATGKVYVEVKLSEREFGTCVLNDDREKKIINHYRPRLTGKVPDTFLTTKEFPKRYQLLRNLSYLADPGDRLMLVVPRANIATFAQAQEFREHVIGDWKQAVVVSPAEELIDRLSQISMLGSVMTEVRENTVWFDSASRHFLSSRRIGNPFN